MGGRKFVSIVLLALLVPAFGLPAAGSDGIAVGTGFWLRFHHGPSTFQLAPGASLAASGELFPSFRLGGKLISGAFFGNATGLEVSFSWAPRIGAWMPGAGIAAQGVLGSTVFYYHGGTEYLDVVFPELTAGVLFQPIRFSFGGFGISALEVVAGTDLLRFGRILVVDLQLFSVFVNL